MSILTFDIETLPTQNEEVIKKISAGIKPPGNIKKKESIDAWMAENYEISLKEAIAKTSFDGSYGRIACICAAGIDRENLFGTGYEMTEEEAIRSFYDFVFDTMPKSFCGHNIAGFDLPFLKHRSIILGIKPPDAMLRAMKAKPWDDCIKDTMLMWNSDRDKRISLDTICWLLGIDHGHPDFNGSMVAENWITDPAGVINYCLSDVIATREVYNRLTFKDNLAF